MSEYEYILSDAKAELREAIKQLPRIPNRMRHERDRTLTAALSEIFYSTVDTIETDIEKPEMDEELEEMMNKFPDIVVYDDPDTVFAYAAAVAPLAMQRFKSLYNARLEFNVLGDQTSAARDRIADNISDKLKIMICEGYLGQGFIEDHASRFLTSLPDNTSESARKAALDNAVTDLTKKLEASSKLKDFFRNSLARYGIGSPIDEIFNNFVSGESKFYLNRSNLSKN